MEMNFHDPFNRKSYSERNIDPAWIGMFSKWVDVNEKIAVDIGCGGGLYSNILAQLGAKQVIGLDYSTEMLITARENNFFPDRLDFRMGNALELPLETESIDLLLERAITHHIQELELCFEEAFRVLKPNGILYIQDRTSEDCFLRGSQEHLRGYFFEYFPQLKEIEAQRRHECEMMLRALTDAGFTSVKQDQLWEIRREYTHASELREDLMSRKGRSLLHALSDQELSVLVDEIEGKIESYPLVEKDRWTIWVAQK